MVSSHNPTSFELTYCWNKQLIQLTNAYKCRTLLTAYRTTWFIKNLWLVIIHAKLVYQWALSMKFADFSQHVRSPSKSYYANLNPKILTEPRNKCCFLEHPSLVLGSYKALASSKQDLVLLKLLTPWYLNFQFLRPTSFCSQLFFHFLFWGDVYILHPITSIRSTQSKMPNPLNILSVEKKIGTTLMSLLIAQT